MFSAEGTTPVLLKHATPQSPHMVEPINKHSDSAAEGDEERYIVYCIKICIFSLSFILVFQFVLQFSAGA